MIKFNNYLKPFYSMFIFQKKFIFIFIFIFLFSCCYKKTNQKKLKNEKIFTALIKGQECNICEKKILDELNSTEYVKHCEFVKEPNGKLVLNIILKNQFQNLDIKHVINIIKTNNFFVESIKGKFEGQIERIDKDFWFKLAGFNYSFKIKLKEKNKIQFNEFITVSGVLKLNYYTNEYQFNFYDL